MPDGRFLNRSVSSNEVLGSVSDAAALLFTWCIPHLDRDGRITGHPVLLKSKVVPLRASITPDDIPSLLRELAPLILWYEVDEKKVLAFPGFTGEQRGVSWYEREAESRFPVFPEGGLDLLSTHSGPTPDQVERPTYSGPTPDQVELIEHNVSKEEFNRTERNGRHGAHARELATYLGEHAHLIDDAAGRANGSCETWALALLGLYVGSGDRAPAEERMLQPIPKEDRPALLATALLRFIGEDQAWDGKFFRGIMRKCVGEHVRGGVEAPDFGDESERDADRAAEARNRASTAAMDESRKAGQAADVALAERREWLDSLDGDERNTVAAEIDKRARQIQPTGKLTRMVIDACLAAVYEERAEVSP